MNLKQYVSEQVVELGVEYVTEQLVNLIDTLHAYQAVSVSPELFVVRCAFGWDAQTAAAVLSSTPQLRVELANIRGGKFPRPSLRLPYPPIERAAFWAYVGLPAPAPEPTP